MDLVVYDPYISEERADRLGAELVVEDLHEALGRGDFATVHTPPSPRPRG